MVQRQQTAWRDDPLVKAWSGLLRLHAEVVPIIDGDLQEATRMSIRWYDILLELYESGEAKMRMSDLGAAVVLSRSRVSRVVDELEKVGYVCRTTDPQDRRSAFACLTDAGRAAFRAAAPVYLEIVSTRLGAMLNDRQAHMLSTILESALSNASKSCRLP